MAGLDSIDHVVLVMLENRSFDHMLGFLYPRSDNFDGLDGTESNPDADGNDTRVFQITPGIQNAYYFSLANPAEGYQAANDQLFSSDTPPASGEAVQPGPNGEVVSGFTRFQSDAANGKLAAFSYIEPEWATHPRPKAPPAGGQADNKHNFHIENDQHPVSNLAVGEKLLYDVYQALRSNGPAWEKTLLIITYDEHGGNYDHVHPPTGAIAPDDAIGPSGFDFTRFGVRVPAVLVSPLIPEGTILHAPNDGRPPFDHTSIIATLRARFGIGALGKRDAAAPDLGSILTLQTARTDDPLAAIVPPTAADPVLQAGSPPVGAAPSSFLEAKAVAAAALPVPTDPIADPEARVKTLRSAADQYNFIQERLTAWRAAGRPLE